VPSLAGFTIIDAWSRVELLLQNAMPLSQIASLLPEGPLS
jgi:hypothetical protein